MQLTCPKCHTVNSGTSVRCIRCQEELDYWGMDLDPPDVGGGLSKRAIDDAAPDTDASNRGRSQSLRREPPSSEPAHSQSPEDDGRRPAHRRSAEPEGPIVRRPSARSRHSTPPPSEGRSLHAGEPAPAPPGWGGAPSSPGSGAIGRQVTVQFEGVDVQRIRPTKRFALQIFGKDGGWHRFQSFDANGIKIGSRERSEDFPQLRTMAARHLRLSPRGSKFVLEDLESLNGVFRRITHPHPLTDGTRFRIGQYLIEFRIAKPVVRAEPLNKDGEELCCVDPVAHAFLIFIRPNGQGGLTFPLTKTVTVLGQEREGRATAIDIHLSAERTSGRHAEVIFKDGGYLLENRSQTNGTFVQIQSGAGIDLNEEILAGQVKFRVVREEA